MKIKITDFAKRHFDPKFNGTKILSKTTEEFEEYINSIVQDKLELHLKIKQSINIEDIHVYNGYAPFCKLIAIRNYTDAKVGSMPITIENYQYLRSGYSARRDSELPVFGRWFELPLPAPAAKYLVLVLYSKEQIELEAKNSDSGTEIFGFDADYGIVAILAQSDYKEEPIIPATIIRNSMGIEYGGSGVPLDKEQYLKSCDFWNKNATVKI